MEQKTFSASRTSHIFKCRKHTNLSLWRERSLRSDKEWKSLPYTHLDNPGLCKHSLISQNR